MSQLVRARANMSGTSANRPAAAPVGFQYLVIDPGNVIDGQTITVYSTGPMVWTNNAGVPV